MSLVDGNYIHQKGNIRFTVFQDIFQKHGRQKKLIRHSSVSSLLCQKVDSSFNGFEGFDRAILIFLTNGQFAT